MTDSDGGRIARTGVSEDGRHFTDGQGNPKFWCGDTQWELCRSYALPDAEAILENRHRLGFNFLQVMLCGVDPEENVEGHRPWRNDDPLYPNDAYFRHADKVIEASGRLPGMTLVLGVQHTARMKGKVNFANARAWARWVAERYRDAPNIVWAMYPRAREEDVPLTCEIAEGLREGDSEPRLITVHPDPSPASSGPSWGQKEWLGFHSIQTFSRVHLIQPMVNADRERRPTKPVVMAEGAYEAGPEYGFEITPLWIRRQACYSYLSGGHHSYGHNAFWRVEPTWRDALDAPGAAQVGILRRALERLEEWWRMEPAEGMVAEAPWRSETVYPIAAKHPRGKWAIVYAGSAQPFALSLEGLGGGKQLKAVFIEPASGASAGLASVEPFGTRSFEPPSGWEDALLVLRAA